jgi:hypothetical protein
MDRVGYGMVWRVTRLADSSIHCCVAEVYNSGTGSCHRHLHSNHTPFKDGRVVQLALLHLYTSRAASIIINRAYYSWSEVDQRKEITMD